MANENNEQLFDAIISFETQGDQDALASARELDDMLEALREGADVNVALAVENDDVLTALADLDGEVYSPEVDVTIDDSELLALEDLDDETISPDVVPTYDDSELTTLEELATETITPDVAPTYDDTEILPFEELADETIEPTVNPQNTEEGKSLLTTLHELGVNPIQIVMNVAGTVLDVISKLEQFTVAPILDAEDAAAKFAGKTGRSASGIADSIRDTLYSDLGDSAAQVGDLYTQADQLGDPFEDATRAALTFTHTFDDQNPTEVLKTLHELVSQGLVDDFDQGADLLTKFYQSGGNKGLDALSTIQQYASSWKDAGLNGEQALGLINSGLDGGIDSAGKAALALQVFDDNLTAAAENPSSDQALFLKKIGLENPKEQGEAAGADFIDAFISKTKDLAPEDQEAGINAFFGKQGKKFTGAIEGLDSGSLGPYEDYVNAAEEAAGQVDDSLRGILDDFVLAINEKVSEILSSDAIDLPGKVQALKTGLQDALDTLSSGGTLEEAITVGLKPIGFDDEFQKLESIFGNLLIGLLQIVASIQDATGHGDQAEKTRAEVGRLSAQQLTFDLQSADYEQIKDGVQTAIDRGVDGSTVSESITTAIDEALDKGNIEQAQALLDTAKELEGKPLFKIADNLNAQDLQTATAALRDLQNVGGDQSQSWRFQEAFDKGIVVQVTPDVDVESLQQQIDDAAAAAKPTIDVTTGKNALGIGFGAAGGDVAPSLAPDPTIIDRGAENLQKISDKAAETKDQLDALSQGTDQYSDAIDNASLVSSGAVGSFGDLFAAAQEATNEVESGAKSMDEALAEADAGITNSISGNTMTEQFELLSTSAQKGSDATIEALERINQVSFDPIESFIDRLAAKITALGNAIVAANAAASKLPDPGSIKGSGGNSSSTNITVNNNNNVQSPAQAYALGQATADGVRGY